MVIKHSAASETSQTFNERDLLRFTLLISSQPWENMQVISRVAVVPPAQGSTEAELVEFREAAQKQALWPT